MATVHADESEEEVTVQSDASRDRVSKKYIAFGVLAMVATVAVVYAIIKRNNLNK